MSGNCVTTPTATLYSTTIVTNVATDVTDGFEGSGEIITQLIPTETLYGTACVDAAVTTAIRTTRRVSSTINGADVTSSTAILPASTATLVSATNRGGQVVYVTSYSTASAASVIIVLKTQTPTTINPATAAATVKPKIESHAGAIAGGIVAAVALLALLAGLVWFCRKRSRRHRDTRALDDFFKDALNPGDAAMAGAGAGGIGSNGRKSTLLRRKSSTMLDLEKDPSNSNDEDNWAALTRLSDQVSQDEITGVHRNRSQSHQSLNAVSRAVSLRSLGPEAVWSNAVDVEGPVEEPISAGKQSMSTNSLNKSPYDESRPMNAKRPSSHISSRSTDMLPALSPGFGSQPASPLFPDSPPPQFSPNRSEDALTQQQRPASPPSAMNRQSHARMTQRLSMSGIQHQSPPQRAMSPPLFQGIPERPKSALGVMSIAEENQELPTEQQLQRQESDQSNFNSLPRQVTSPQWTLPNRQGSTGARLQSRASINGYMQSPHPQWSPPNGPQRYGSPPLQHYSNQQQRRQQTFSGEYPPSRYSHLDIVSGSTEGEMPPSKEKVRNDSRPRSASGGGILMRPGVEALQMTNADAQIGSTTSSTSTSKKNSLSIRNASPEETSEEEDNSNKKNSVLMNSTSSSSNSDDQKNTSTEEEEEVEDATQKSPETADLSRITSFFSPRAWRART